MYFDNQILGPFFTDEVLLCLGIGPSKEQETLLSGKSLEAQRKQNWNGKGIKKTKAII